MEIKKASKMANVGLWLHEGALVDYSDTAAAPCKDFYHVYVTAKEIIFRFWKIVPPTRTDSNSKPTEKRGTYDEFLHDDVLQSEVARLAGENTLNYLVNLAKGHIDCLPRLPKDVLTKIFTMLDLEDNARMSVVCKHFRELSDSDDVWEKIYRKYSQTPVTPDLEDLAVTHTWKRLFYTNKLQLQMQLRRQKRHDEEKMEQQVSL